MRIAQIAPLWEAVPPKTYGGTELVVHLLTEALVEQGHEVTLFASGDSQTQARRISVVQESFRLHPIQLPFYHELRSLEQVFQRAGDFDVIHNHLGAPALPFASLSSTPMVTTLHGAFKPKALREFFELYPQLPYISISDYQRTACPQLNYVATLYHGLDLKRFSPSYTIADKNYLAFLGRFSAEKGPHHAIRIAKATGWKLIMAGKVDLQDREFYREEIEPLIDGTQIQMIGEVDHVQKVNLLSQAAATLCPVTWPEPFGLVLIESMACGTPVFALRDGSIPEIIKHGETGFIEDTVEGLLTAIDQLKTLDRRLCRHHVERHFSVQQMTARHVDTYRLLVEESGKNRYHTQQLPSLAVSRGVF